MNEKEHEQLLSLGAKVRYYRFLKKWSQEKLSEMSGIDTKTLSYIENGHNNVKFLTLYRLAQIFGIEVSDLTNFKL